jgi:hypothetical protein
LAVGGRLQADKRVFFVLVLVLVLVIVPRYSSLEDPRHIAASPLDSPPPVPMLVPETPPAA